MRQMYDGISADAARIPANAPMVAGYVDGRYAWSAADWARFPHSVKVRIAVFATTDDGHVLDVEPGNDMTPSHWVSWVQMRRRAGVDPAIYVNQNNGWNDVRSAFRAAHVPEPHYWVANYDGVQVIPAGAIAKQYEDAGVYDRSVVADYWPGVDPVPATPPKEKDMLVIRNITGSPEVWAQIGSLYWHVASVGDLNAYKSAFMAAGVPVATVTVSAVEHQNLLAAHAVASVTPHAAVLGTATGDSLKVSTGSTGTLS